MGVPWPAGWPGIGRMGLPVRWFLQGGRIKIPAPSVPPFLACHHGPIRKKPFSGLKVVELGTLIAGPFCTRILGEFGAEVVKVESPDGGDPLRLWRKLQDGTSLWWSVQARNKRSVTANLKHPGGKEFVRRLIAGADILVENFRPGVLESWGFPGNPARDNPGLVMVRLSGFGQTGPYKDQPGFGSVGESMGGLRYVTGFPDRRRCAREFPSAIPSRRCGAIGALMALRHREVNGGAGRVVDVALYEAVFAMMESLVPEFDVFGFVRERTGNIMPGITPSNTHTTRDGKHVAIGGNGMPSSGASWPPSGVPDLAADPGLADNAGRDGRRTRSMGRWMSGARPTTRPRSWPPWKRPRCRRPGVLGGRHVCRSQFLARR